MQSLKKEGQMIMKDIKTFLETNLDNYSPIKWKIISITDQTPQLTNDAGNEFLFFAHCQPADENIYYSEHEPCINTRKLNDLLGSQDFAQGDHGWHLEQYIGLNTTILIPISLLK